MRNSIPGTNNAEKQYTARPGGACRRPMLVFCMLALLTGPVLTALCAIQDGQNGMAWIERMARPGFWVTALMLSMISLSFSLITGQLAAGGFITALPALMITLINYYKVNMTSTPLSIGDFSLVFQLGSIASLNRAAIAVSDCTVIVMGLAVLWLVLLAVISRYLSVAWTQCVLPGLTVLLGFGVCFWVFADPLIFAPLQVKSDRILEQVVVNSRCSGPILGLWRSYYCAGIREEIEVITEERIEEYLQEAEANGTAMEVAVDTQQPNLIVIQSESFFDVTRLEGVAFDEDPVAAFHALQSEGVSGRFYTRSLGYGTCNVELEILTGLNTGLLSGEDLYAFSAEKLSALPSVPALLVEEGYETSLIHPYGDYIYQRSAFYPELGIQNLYFDSGLYRFYAPLSEVSNNASDYTAYHEYLNSRKAGNYASDDFLTDLIIAKYENSRENSNAPQFLFSASMENHQPYNDNKYSDEELTVSVTAESLDDEALEILTAFTQGCYDASVALADLVDYFRDCDEPTIIVFWGITAQVWGRRITARSIINLGLSLVNGLTGRWRIMQNSILRTI